MVGSNCGIRVHPSMQVVDTASLPNSWLVIPVPILLNAESAAETLGGGVEGGHLFWVLPFLHLLKLPGKAANILPVIKHIEAGLL